MLYLIAAILVSCTLTFVLKVAHVKGWNAKNITMVNYVFALATAWITCAAQGKAEAFRRLGEVDFSTLFSGQSVGNTIFFCLVLGSVTGALFVANIILTNANVRNNGAGISTLFGRGGFLISIALSIALFGERMTWMHWTGVALTLVALAVAGGLGGSARLVKPALLLAALLCVGVLDANNKFFSAVALQDYKANFTAVVFSVATAIYVVVYSRHRRQQRMLGEKPGFRWQELLAGMVMGIPNAFGSIFQILALESIPASVMFPSMAAGNLLLSTLLSRFVFKEPFGRRQALAVGLTTVSLVLVNI